MKKFDPKTTSDGTVVLHPNRAFVGQPDHDLNTIFVGNLPPWIDEPKVRHLTSQCGTVRNVQVRDSKNPHRGEYLVSFGHNISNAEFRKLFFQICLRGV